MDNSAGRNGHGSRGGSGSSLNSSGSPPLLSLSLDDAAAASSSSSSSSWSTNASSTLMMGRSASRSLSPSPLSFELDAHDSQQQQLQQQQQQQQNVAGGSLGYSSRRAAAKYNSGSNSSTGGDSTVSSSTSPKTPPSPSKLSIPGAQFGSLEIETQLLRAASPLSPREDGEDKRHAPRRPWHRFTSHSPTTSESEKSPDSEGVTKKHHSSSMSDRSHSSPIVVSVRRAESSSADYPHSPMTGSASSSYDKLYNSKSQPLTRQNSNKATVDVKETAQMVKDYDEEGRKVLNNYVVIDELGRGIQGKVKRCYDTLSPEHKLYAMKIVKKKKKRTLGTQEDPMQKIRREIAILKKCDHPNVVKLYEVIDDPTKDKVYLVLELVENGACKWTNQGAPVMCEDEARVYFRDVLLGLEYLHYQGIVHRDIKPANLLVTNDNHLKISDFGVSYITQNTNEDGTALSKTAGSPAFFAPEMCCTEDSPSKPISKMIDLWALGATLYCFMFGRTPFWGENEFDLYEHIIHDPLTFPDEIEATNDVKDVLLQLLNKDPDKRANFAELKLHPWVTADLPDARAWIESTDPSLLDAVTVSEAEMSKAFTFLSSIKKHLRRLSDTFRTAFSHRKGSTSSIDSSGSSPSLSGGRSPRARAVSTPLSEEGAEDQLQKDISTLLSIGNPEERSPPLTISPQEKPSSWTGSVTSHPLARSFTYSQDDPVSAATT